MNLRQVSSWFCGLVAALWIGAPFSTVTYAHNPPFTRTFQLSTCGGFSSTGRNPYFVLVPGFRLVLEGEEDGEHVVLEITVLHQTIQIGGLTARIVEERESKGGRLIEISQNYFVFCNRNNSALYLGEDVAIFEDDGSISHEGAWRAGVAGAAPGIIMPGVVLLGARYFQEVAAGVAMDRAEIVSVNEVVATPVGTFGGCLKTEETTPLEPGASEFKFYATGIGLIREKTLRLTSAGFVS